MRARRSPPATTSRSSRWLLLRGRCRSCGEPISPRYPLIELGLGCSSCGDLPDPRGRPDRQLALGLVLCALLVTITLTDLDLRVIPNALVIAGAVVAVAIVAVPTRRPRRARDRRRGGRRGLFLVVMAYPRGMGMGDAKLVAMMGLYLGRAIAPAVLIGFLVGAVVGVAMIARHGAAARKQAIPFGPFLALGGIVGLWFGDEIVDWYLDEFFSTPHGRAAQVSQRSSVRPSGRL